MEKNNKQDIETKKATLIVFILSFLSFAFMVLALISGFILLFTVCLVIWGILIDCYLLGYLIRKLNQIEQRL